MRARLQRYVERRPVTFCALLAAGLALFLVARHWLLGAPITYARALSGEVALLGLGLGLVALLGWWRRAGIASAPRWDWAAAAVAGALAYFLALDAAAFVVYRVAALGFLLAALVGAAEEILCRGVALEALRRLGPLAAGAGSALFFGLLHLNNLLLSPSPAVVAQAVYAVLLGLFLAAARLRLGSIWPVAALHAGIDAPALATGHFLPPPAPNPWLPLLPIALSLPWGVVGLGMLLWDELRRR